jgi:hypothetical protein
MTSQKFLIGLAIFISAIFIDQVFVGAAFAQDVAEIQEAAKDAIKEAENAAPAGTTAGNQALQLWNSEGVENSPLWVQVWLQIMTVAFILGLLFVWKKVEARFVVIGVLVSVFGARFVASGFDLLMLSGYVALAHLICWSPALYVFFKNKPWKAAADNFYDKAYKYWAMLITFVICFSFIFDIRDAAIYLDYMLGTGLLS